MKFIRFKVEYPRSIIKGTQLVGIGLNSKFRVSPPSFIKFVKFLLRSEKFFVYNKWFNTTRNMTKYMTYLKKGKTFTTIQIKNSVSSEYFFVALIKNSSGQLKNWLVQTGILFDSNGWNFSNARVFCVVVYVSLVDPEKNILITKKVCTTHSDTKTKKGKVIPYQPLSLSFNE